MRRGKRAVSSPVMTGPVSSITYDEFCQAKRSNYPSFQTDEDFLDSWLSSITGIHINPLDLGATKVDLGQAARTVGAIASAATGNLVAAGGLIGQNIKNSGLLTPGTPTVDTSSAVAALPAPAPTLDYVNQVATYNGITVPLPEYNQLGMQAFAQRMPTISVTATPNPWLLVGGVVLLLWVLTPSKHHAETVS